MVRPEVQRGTLVRLTAPRDAVPAKVFGVTTGRERLDRLNALMDHLAARVGEPDPAL